MLGSVDRSSYIIRYYLQVDFCYDGRKFAGLSLLHNRNGQTSIFLDEIDLMRLIEPASGKCTAILVFWKRPTALTLFYSPIKSNGNGQTLIFFMRLIEPASRKCTAILVFWNRPTTLTLFYSPIKSHRNRGLIYCKISNVRHIKFQNFSSHPDSRLTLQLPLSNPLKPDVKSRKKM